MSLDRKDAYFHIQVAPHHRRFLRFAFEGVAYEYKVLPFGLSLAPRTFTRCMDAAISPLRQMGICILDYLDNWLILAQSVLTSSKTLLLSHLDCLGLRVNFAKSILSPSQPVSFLGTDIDSVQMTATVSVEWATTIQRHAAYFEEARPLKAFQRILGLMTAASPVLRLGLLHMQPIQFWLKQRVPSSYSSSLGTTYHTEGLKRAPVWTIAIHEPQSILVKNRPAVSTGVGQASRRSAGLILQPDLPGIRPNDSKVILKPRLVYVPRVLSTPFRAQVKALSALPPSTGNQALSLLCPFRALSVYIEYSASYRKSEKLFVGFGNCAKGGPVM